MENEEKLKDVTLPETGTGNTEDSFGNNAGAAMSVKTLWHTFRNNPRYYGLFQKVLYILIALFSLFISLVFMLYTVPSLMEQKKGPGTEIVNYTELKKDAGYRAQISLLNRDIQRLARKYNSYTSGQSYIVINTTGNRFSLYRNKKLIREGFCSTGSLMMLKTEKGNSWVFKTPKGKRTIQGKITNPYWKRPDWSFVEEGLPIPPKNDPSRFESGVLGDYAMGIGDGYLIHGTIYKRFLGMPVTHGCVRLNDEDLEAVYNTLNIGSKVFIF